MKMHKVSTLISFVLSLPKTIWFNFKYLPFKDALKLPIFVSRHVWLMDMKGQVRLGVIRTGIVKIGFGEVAIFDWQRARSIWQVSGTVEFKGSAKIGHGSKLSVLGDLTLGNNFAISAESSIVSHKKITVGDDVLISWDVLIMDTDLHEIHAEDGSYINPPQAISIGDKVWIGCRSLVLKGVSISDGMVIAASTTVTKSVESKNAIIGGNPVRVLKENISWKR
ncbi:WbbJ Acetyltransferase (isoleucine patch superfamily) [Methylophilaceae bacterium]